MELPEQPATDPLPPSRPQELVHDYCGDIHCDGSCLVPAPHGVPLFNITSWPP